MNKAIKVIGAGVVIAVLAVMLLLQRQDNARLSAGLAEAQEKATRLDTTEEALKTSRAAIEEEDKKLQDLQSEVMRLRGDASRAARAEAEAARLRSASQQVQSSGTSPAPANSSGDPLVEFLGAPLQPPPNLSQAYTKQGLLNALQQAAQQAGVPLNKVEVDDSEFPYLLGVVTEKGGMEKIKEQLRKMDGYSYGGSVGGDSSATFTITPLSVFSSGVNQRTTARYMLRMQVLNERLQGSQ